VGEKVEDGKVTAGKEQAPGNTATQKTNDLIEFFYFDFSFLEKLLEEAFHYTLSSSGSFQPKIRSHVIIIRSSDQSNF